MSKIEINNIYKIFGNKPGSVMQMVRDGATKDEVLEQTGHTIGLDNVSLKIEEGETFVCMGLSGSGKSTLIRHINRLIDPTEGEIHIDGTNIMQGINQCTMMALSMVVIASMIGTRGLGDEVLLGLQQLNVGRAAEAGIAIVLLAIVLDRITQSYGETLQERNSPTKTEKK